MQINEARPTASSKTFEVEYACEITPQTPDTMQLQERLEASWRHIDGVTASVAAIADHLFGGLPRDCEATANAPVSGSIGHLFDLCNRIDAALSELSGEVSRLSRL